MSFISEALYFSLSTFNAPAIAGEVLSDHPGEALRTLLELAARDIPDDWDVRVRTREGLRIEEDGVAIPAVALGRGLVRI